MGSEARFSLKVPPLMRDDLSYNEWKQELEWWLCGTEIVKAKQGITLAWSLTGDVRKTIMSEVPLDDINCDNGVDNILKVLDKHFAKDTALAGLLAFDDFIEYKRPKSMSIADFLIRFNLKYNAMKSHKMEVPDNILAAILLKCCNLPEDKASLCRMSCSPLTYDEMKKKLQSVGAGVMTSSNQNAPSNSLVKVEPTFHGECTTGHSEYNQSSSTSDDDESDAQQGFYAHSGRKNFSGFYGNKNSKFQRNFQSNKDSGKPKLNQCDQFGNVTACGFCKSIYHWIEDCPDAPPEYKQRKPYQKKKKSSRGPF